MTERRLFKFYIDQNTQNELQKKQFYFRTNRWRFNTMDKGQLTKFFKIRNPLIVAFGSLIIYDYTYGFNRQDAHH